MDNTIKEINAIRRKLKENDKQTISCMNVREYDKLKEERDDLYLRMKMLAEDLAKIAQIKFEIN